MATEVLQSRELSKVELVLVGASGTKGDKLNQSFIRRMVGRFQHLQANTIRRYDRWHTVPLHRAPPCNRDGPNRLGHGRSSSLPTSTPPSFCRYCNCHPVQNRKDDSDAYKALARANYRHIKFAVIPSPKGLVRFPNSRYLPPTSEPLDWADTKLLKAIPACRIRYASYKGITGNCSHLVQLAETHKHHKPLTLGPWHSGADPLCT